jgi:uracil permease
MKRRVIGIHERMSVLESIPLSLQHLTAMFGATILVPILLKVDPAIALLMNGIGTLIYSWVTKGGIPAYLGSSFAFIAPVMLIAASYGGFAHAQAGFIFFGLFFIVISWVVYKWGIRWIDVVMPPAVMGAVVAIIGLELAPVAAGQAGLIAGNVTDSNVLLVSMFTLSIGILGSVLFKGFFPGHSHPDRCRGRLYTGFMPGHGGHDLYNRGSLVCTPEISGSCLRYHRHPDHCTGLPRRPGGTH